MQRECTTRRSPLPRTARRNPQELQPSGLIAGVESGGFDGGDLLSPSTSSCDGRSGRRRTSRSSGFSPGYVAALFLDRTGACRRRFDAGVVPASTHAPLRHNGRAAMFDQDGLLGPGTAFSARTALSARRDAPGAGLLRDLVQRAPAAYLAGRKNAGGSMSWRTRGMHCQAVRATAEVAARSGGEKGPGGRPADAGPRTRGRPAPSAGRQAEASGLSRSTGRRSSC